MRLIIQPDGDIQCVYGEQINLACFGQMTIVRASHVEPDEFGCWWVDLCPMSGPKLGPFTRRSQALNAERQWLNDHLTRQERRCQICDREPGTQVDRFRDPDPLPLGELKRCQSCGLLVCPDCLHEADCCFRDEEEHEDEPNWAPPGWTRIGERWIREVASSI